MKNELNMNVISFPTKDFDNNIIYAQFILDEIISKNKSKQIISTMEKFKEKTVVSIQIFWEKLNKKDN